MREIDVAELEIKPIPLFRDTWGALCAGTDEAGFNAMAIAWGSIGTLWERGNRKKMVPVCNVYVRPSRYTYPLMKEAGCFTVSFMADKKWKRSLGFIGAKSGRDYDDKIAAAGLTLVRDAEYGYMEGADLVLECRTIYAHQLDEPHLLEKELLEYNYHGQTDNIHEMFVGEIMKVLVAE